jgi:hypothetical protein
MKTLFVSYRREDTAELVHALTEILKRLLIRDRFFIDITIPPGSSFIDALDRALEACDAALVVIGPRWLGAGEKGQRRIDDEGDFVRMETERLLARNIPVIPVLVSGAQMPTRAELPSPIAALAVRQAIVLSDNRADVFPQSVIDALLRAIRRWRLVPIKDQTGTITSSYSWRDITWLTDTEGWLCGAKSEGGAGGHVGYGILLRTTDGGATWQPSKNILSGQGEFNWGGYRYNWTDVGPIYSILVYSRQRTEGEEITNGYIATMTGVYRAVAARAGFTHELEWRRLTPEPGGAVPFTHFSWITGIEGDNELYATGWAGIANWIRGGRWTLQMKTFTFPIGMVDVAGGSDNRNVWAVGRAGEDDFGNRGSESHGALYHLDWPANQWRRVLLPGIEFEEKQNLLGLQVIDRSHVFVVGEKSLVISGIRERGDEWVWQRVPVPSRGTAMHRIVVNELGLWAIGANGTILHSVDGGSHWTSLDVTDVSNTLLGIRFHGTTGWIVGDNVVLTCT